MRQAMDDRTKRNRSPRMLAAVLAMALVALLAVSVAPASATDFLGAAKKGIRNTRVHWWNPGERWYNDRLDDRDPFPLATTWSVVPLFEAVDGVAIGQPNSANRKAARSFANVAERYFNGDLAPHGGYSPYKGDRGADNHVWMDDNSWWGQAFIDAYRATRNKRYIKDAKTASDFVDARGWEGGGGNGGMWWESQHQTHSLEAMAAATALSAELYEVTNNAKYRARAIKYIDWADAHAFSSKNHLYRNSTQPIMSYVEGSMIGANLSLCKKGDKVSCARMERLAGAARTWWGENVDFGPQFDTIMFRFLVQLSAYDRDPRWWDWAKHNGDRALRNAEAGGLLLKFWDGSGALAHQAVISHYGQIQTHTATVALFGWLAAVPRP